MIRPGRGAQASRSVSDDTQGMRQMPRTLLRATCLFAALSLAAPFVARTAGKPLPGGRLAHPLDEVYVVTSRERYQRHAAFFGHKLADLHDAKGAALVVARVQEHRLADLGQHIHDNDRACGGYFAFATEAEARRFATGGAHKAKPRAMGMPYTIDNARVVNALMPQVSEQNIRGTIATLSSYPNRYYNSVHGQNAAGAIRNMWLGLAGKRSDVSAELFTACGNCGIQPSVILTIRGTTRPNEVVVLGGHLDSISNSGSGNGMNAPGADDDASGISTLTEILRVAMRNGYRPQRTVKFMGYAAEEVGLRGSRAIAQAYAAQGVDVVGVLQLDMTNYRTGTVDMRISTDNTDPALAQFFAQLFDAYLAPMGHTRATDTCGYACSDHASWTQSGFPAAMMFEAGDGGTQYFPWIHTVNDTLPQLGSTAAPSVPLAQFGIAFMAEMGKGSAIVGSTQQGGRPDLPTPVPGTGRPRG